VTAWAHPPAPRAPARGSPRSPPASRILAAVDTVSARGSRQMGPQPLCRRGFVHPWRRPVFPLTTAGLGSPVAGQVPRRFAPRVSLPAQAQPRQSRRATLQRPRCNRQAARAALWHHSQVAAPLCSLYGWFWPFGKLLPLLTAKALNCYGRAVVLRLDQARIREQTVPVALIRRNVRADRARAPWFRRPRLCGLDRGSRSSGSPAALEPRARAGRACADFVLTQEPYLCHCSKCSFILICSALSAWREAPARKRCCARKNRS